MTGQAPTPAPPAPGQMRRVLEAAGFSAESGPAQEGLTRIARQAALGYAHQQPEGFMRWNYLFVAEGGRP